MPVKGSITDIRQRLRHARTVEQALAVLREADFAALQDLQRDLGCLPTADMTRLRQRLADAHVELIALAEHGTVVLDTERVTAEVVASWAVETIAEWLPGYSDFTEELGGQYRITLIYQSANARVFEITTVEGYDARRFRVSVTVAPIA